MISKIKEFLKPNFGKIIFTVIFGLMALFYGVNRCSSTVELCPFQLDSIFWGWGSFFLSYISGITEITDIMDYWITLIFGIIYWYLIASVVMYSYSILKNEFIKKNNR